MDLVEYYNEYRILCCKVCKVGLHPRRYARHLYTSHPRAAPELASYAFARRFVDTVLLPSLADPPLQPHREPITYPNPGDVALESLKIFSGFGCTYCASVLPTRATANQHFNENHAPKRRRRGGLKGTAKGKLKERIDHEHYGDQAAWTVVYYQRFFRKGKGSKPFWVTVPGTRHEDELGRHLAGTPLHQDAIQSHWTIKHHESGQRDRRTNHAIFSQGDRTTAEDVLAELEQLEEDQRAHAPVRSQPGEGSQVSPWLERTRWLHYLEGIPLAQAARLGRPTCPVDEPILLELGQSLDRLIEAAYTEVCEDKINIFGQKRITSFIPGREVYSKPLVFKLQDGTYRQYKMVWKRALAFICRSIQGTDDVRLSHYLTSEQSALLDSALSLAAQHIATSGGTTELLDRKCLDLCISLLDQRLTGKIFDSALVGFFAVLGIDEANDTFFDAVRYTPKLSAFIKIAQLLVLHKAIVTVEDGSAPDPLYALDEMRLRFMTLDNPTPFTWALQLRAFGKRIRDSTTSIGHVRWSDDAQILFYCQIEMSLDGFREFVRQKVYQAQQLLEQLLFVGADDERGDVVPPLSISQLRDNPADISPAWNFLHDARNQKALQGGSTWLLKRVLAEEPLREQFCTSEVHKKVAWNMPRLNGYKRTANEFLEVLLLLVHITGGQPARGTEIVGIAHTNTTFHRNIFLEEGLVAIVTSYHKGYTCTGSTKIIHRYLPSEVGELFVFYLWLVLPFIQKVGLLQRKQSCFADALESQSPFLWPASKDTPWSSTRLSSVLKRETHDKFKAPLSVATYRHIAIAMSRRHLEGGGFKRDYGVEEHAGDWQTAHTTWTAGRLYARGLEEAPGHVESRRAGYRAISRRWHMLLGFTVPQVKRRLPFQDVTNLQPQKRQKRDE